MICLTSGVCVDFHLDHFTLAKADTTPKHCKLTSDILVPIVTAIMMNNYWKIDMVPIQAYVKGSW